MIFRTNPRARAREVAAQVRLQAALERQLSPKIRTEIRRTATAAASDIRHSSGLSGLQSHITAHQQKMESLLAEHYRRTAGVFGDRVMSQVGKSGPRYERKDAQGIFESAIESFIRRFAARQAKLISDTTRQQIAQAVMDGEREGLGIADIADLIEENTGGTIAGVRAGVIARTETHNAATAASSEAAQATGLKLRRTWGASSDERTRTAHADADGETVDEGGYYLVGGERMSRPGDPDASPENTINCRCVELFDPEF